MPKSSVATDEPVNNYYAGGSRRAAQLAQSMPARTSKSISAVQPKKSGKVIAMGPTPERLRKGDLVQATGGSYVAESGLDRLRRAHKEPMDPEAMVRAQSVLQRLHHRVSLDRDPGMSDRMYEAGRRYEELVQIAGLGGVKAQDLLAVRGNLTAESDGTARALLQLRKVWTILPRKVASAMHGMLVEGRDPEEVGADLSTYVSKKERTTAGLTTLRIALWTLVEAKWA